MITNGTNLEIGYTGKNQALYFYLITFLIGTDLIFKPGNLYGGELEFDCGVERSIVYFLEMLLVLAPFSKKPIGITLKGMTCDDKDVSIDMIKNANIRVLKYFGVCEGLDFKILKRGSPPLGGGEIYFKCPVVNQLSPVIMLDAGKIKKIRGVASTTRVSPHIANRMIEICRNQLNKYIPDIFIYSDVFKGKDAGLSPGYSLYIHAESTTDVILACDGIGKPDITVEEMAQFITKKLLRLITKGGVVGQSQQWMIIMMMSLCSEDLSKIALGPLHPSILENLLPDIKKMLGISFKIVPDTSNNDGVIISCIGSGICNLNRRIN